MGAQGHPSRKRMACDRCHGQKLRCPRLPSKESCTRCQKAGVRCIFSDSKRGPYRQAHEAPAEPMPAHIGGSDWNQFDTYATNTPMDHAIDLDALDIERGPPVTFDYAQAPPIMEDIYQFGKEPHFEFSTGLNSTDIDVHQTFANEHAGSEHIAASDMATMREGPLSNREYAENKATSTLEFPGDRERTAKQRPSTALSYQLLELSRKLVEHDATVPPVSIHGSSSTQHQENGSEGMTPPSTSDNNSERSYAVSAKEYPFSIEHSFQLTQALVELYTQLDSGTCTALNGRPRESAMEPLTMNLASSPRITDRAEEVSAPLFDEASIHLILSCHHRIIDVWTKVFSHMQTMCEHGVFKRPGFAQKDPCSRLRIGSFTPSSPKASATIMMMLIAETVAALMTSIQNFTDRLTSPQSSMFHGANDNLFIYNADNTGNHTSQGNCRRPMTEGTKLACDAALERSTWLKEISDRARAMLVAAEVID